MSLKDFYKIITKNFSILVSTIKNDLKNTLENIKAVLKIITKDKGDVVMFIIVVILSIIDFVTKINLTGAIAFLGIYILRLLIRMAIWKWKAANKQ